jgi:hypothetical protein
VPALELPERDDWQMRRGHDSDGVTVTVCGERDAGA